MSKTVLVVEDERSLLKAIIKKLENNGFLVISARSVRQALEALKLHKVDAIWLDHYLLGEDDGLKFVTQIKEKASEWKDIPIYVVSNSATDQKVNAYMQLGATKYFAKSDYKLEEIINEIKKL